ncbi:hypothetical protein Tco_0234688, partial [Tanacetum coccineum]
MGKENGENILQSIDEGLFKMGKFRETLADGALGPERGRVFKDLTPEEKEMYKADIRGTDILLQGSRLTNDDRESQLYDELEHFCQNKGETIHDYYVSVGHEFLEKTEHFRHSTIDFFTLLEDGVLK